MKSFSGNGMKTTKFTKLIFYVILILALFRIQNACSDQKEQNWDMIMTGQGLVNVQDVDSTILVELRYSGTDNFMEMDVYGDLEQAYLQPEVAQMLANASDSLKAAYPGYKLLVYDGARPRRIQQILWDIVDIPLEERSKYVADPKKGSIHNFGCAVDLTVADDSGKPLDMGTGYDNFTPLAHIDNENERVASGSLSEEQLANRLILRKAMLKAGFQTISSEWWHFNAFPNEVTKSKFKIIE